MSHDSYYKDAFPFIEDVLNLPVSSVDEAATWYATKFGFSVVERQSNPISRVTMQRGAAKIGFAEVEGDPTQDGAAILVSDIADVRSELESNGVETGNWRVDERDGQKLQVFFVVAPDGLCYYFHEPIEE